MNRRYSFEESSEKDCKVTGQPLNPSASHNQEEKSTVSTFGEKCTGKRNNALLKDPIKNK